MTKPFNIGVHVLFRREESFWVAQGLDYDIAAQGTTIRDAAKAFERAFVCQIIADIREGCEPLCGVEPAPRSYWEAYQDGETLIGRHQPVKVPFDAIPPAYIINARVDERRVSN